MFKKTATGIAFAAGCMIALGAMPAAQAQDYSNPELITNGPQANPGDMQGNGTAHRNVAASNQYERLLQSNSGFRSARMHKECGPITDPQLHEQCVDSFSMNGSSSR